MKKLRLLTVSTLLLAGSMAAFTSCGGGESDSDKKEEKKGSESGYALVKQMMDAFDKGDLEMYVSSADDVKKVMDIDSDDDDYISLDKKFKGYDFDASFTIEDDALAGVSCNTFYDDDEEEAAEKDAKEVLEYLEGILGKSDSSSDTYFDWVYGDLDISFSIYDDGYSLYIDPMEDMSYESESTGDNCVGDFYNLKKDLTDLFLTNVKNGSIKLGSTTKSEMAAITGDGEGYDKEYDGLRLLGSFTYSGDVLSGITLDYFYDCDGALSLLDMDKGDITDEINTGLGVTGESDGDYEDAGTDWTINGMSIRQANFSDGYSIYFE